MELCKDEVFVVLLQVVKFVVVFWKNDFSVCDVEGLECYVVNVYGEVLEWVVLEENGVKFEVLVLVGQKIGWFYDYCMNCVCLVFYVQGKWVFDLFSYIGGWGIQVVVFGVSEVMCVDVFVFVFDGVECNVVLNGVVEKVVCVEGDVFEVLCELKVVDECFDVVIVDLLVFIKCKKDLKNGEVVYCCFNEQVMCLLSKDGILVSVFCLMYLFEDDLQNILIGSVCYFDCNIQLFECGGQGFDYLVYLVIVEICYIKSLICWLLFNG